MLAGCGVAQALALAFQFFSVLLQLFLLSGQLSGRNFTLFFKLDNFQAQRPGIGALGFTGQIFQTV